MRKIDFLLFLLFGFFIVSCGNAETKADRNAGDTIEKKNIPDSVKEPVPDSNSVKSGTARGISISTEPDDILTNIDSYLVSKATFTSAGTSGGILNGVVTIENTLTDAGFQKAIIEVSILLTDGKEYRTDYYTIQNLEPGVKKTVRIPNTTRGASVICHVVKLKSAELTKGEMILVGSRYVPN